MKISVDRSVLRKAIDVVSIALNSKDAQNEWTKGIKFEAGSKVGDGKLCLTATDTVLGAKIIVDATIEGDVEFLVNGELLSKIVDCFVDQTVQFEVGDKLIIKSGKDSGEYEQMRKDDFSFAEVPSDAKWFTLPVDVIAGAKDKVGFATLKGEMKPKFSSVHFALEDNTLNIVACDGSRLAISETTVAEGIPKLQILIITEFLGRISNGLKTIGAKDTIDVYLQEERAYFRSEGVLFSTSLVNDSYFNYKKIVPERVNFAVSVDNKELARKVKMAKIANEYSADANATKTIGVKGTEEGFGQGALTVVSSATASNKQTGEISYTVDSGEVPKEFCLWINPDHILEILSKLGNTVQFEIVDQNSPFIVKTKDANDGYIIVVMPKVIKKKEGN